KGRLVRVAPEGFYEVTLESGGKYYTTLLPVSNTVRLAAEPEEAVPALEVKRQRMARTLTVMDVGLVHITRGIARPMAATDGRRGGGAPADRTDHAGKRRA